MSGQITQLGFSGGGVSLNALLQLNAQQQTLPAPPPDPTEPDPPANPAEPDEVIPAPPWRHVTDDPYFELNLPVDNSDLDLREAELASLREDLQSLLQTDVGGDIGLQPDDLDVMEHSLQFHLEPIGDDGEPMPPPMPTDQEEQLQEIAMLKQILSRGADQLFDDEEQWEAPGTASRVQEALPEDAMPELDAMEGVDEMEGAEDMEGVEPMDAFAQDAPAEEGSSHEAGHHPGSQLLKQKMEAFEQTAVGVKPVKRCGDLKAVKRKLAARAGKRSWELEREAKQKLLEKRDFSSRAICHIKRILREARHLDEITADEPLVISMQDWHKLYKPILGDFKTFLLSRPDQFRIVTEVVNGDMSEGVSITLAESTTELVNNPPVPSRFRKNLPWFLRTQEAHGGTARRTATKARPVWAEELSKPLPRLARSGTSWNELMRQCSSKSEPGAHGTSAPPQTCSELLWNLHCVLVSLGTPIALSELLDAYQKHHGHACNIGSFLVLKHGLAAALRRIPHVVLLLPQPDPEEDLVRARQSLGTPKEKFLYVDREYRRRLQNLRRAEKEKAEQRVQEAPATDTTTTTTTPLTAPARGTTPSTPAAKAANVSKTPITPATEGSTVDKIMRIVKPKPSAAPHLQHAAQPSEQAAMPRWSGGGRREARMRPVWADALSKPFPRLVKSVVSELEAQECDNQDLDDDAKEESISGMDPASPVSASHGLQRLQAAKQETWDEENSFLPPDDVYFTMEDEKQEEEKDSAVEDEDDDEDAVAFFEDTVGSSQQHHSIKPVSLSSPAPWRSLAPKPKLPPWARH